MITFNDILKLENEYNTLVKKLPKHNGHHYFVENGKKKYVLPIYICDINNDEPEEIYPHNKYLVTNELDNVKFLSLDELLISLGYFDKKIKDYIESL